MKHTTHFVSTRLVSLVLSLFLVFGTAASSLSAVTDLSITDQPASAAPALDGAAGTVASAADASYGVAEGSLLAKPADDDVLDIDLDDDTPAAALSAPLTLSRDKNTDLAATGADPYTGALNATSYYIGAANSNYKLVKVNNSWRVQRVSDESYMRNDYGSVYWNGTPTTFSVTNSSTGATINSGNYYVIYQSDIGISRTNSKVYLYSVNSSYIVTFNANGGTGTMADQTILGTANLTANAFTREGYSFTGWNTAADGTGTSYADKASVTLTESITLYAQWQQDAPPASTNTLYFTNVNGWNDLKAYLYNDTTGAKNTAFPGTTMTDLHKDDGYGHGIYSIEADPSVYEYVIFSNTDTSGGNTTAHAQTVSIKIEDALANGAGIYCVPSGSGYETDSQGHLQVNCYTYGDKSSTGDPDTITYTKQIEKLNPSNTDDYNYRLHLNVDGTSLKDESTETTPGETGKNIAFIIDVSDTMTATWSSTNPGKLELVRQLLMGSGAEAGAIDDLIAHNNVEIIAVWGGSDQSTEGTNTGKYTNYYKQLTASEKEGMSKSVNGWNSLHKDKTLSYTTAFLAIDEIYGSDAEVSVVFLAGNGPGSYVVYNPGQGFDRTKNQVGNGYNNSFVDTNTAIANNLVDCKRWIDNHPNATVYGLGVESQSGKLEHDGTTNSLETISTYVSPNGNNSNGGYFGATDITALSKQLQNIITKIIPSDKTSNITVTDTLSKYVDFATSKNLTATLYTDYDATNDTWGSTETYTETSPELSVIGDKVTFSRADEIEGPFKLEIVFDIKTADGVLQNPDTYGATGYPNEGDAGTDYLSASYNRNFSANKPGYYANSSATINYTLNGTAKSGTFKHPVVQAPAETPVQGKYIFKYIDRYDTWRTVEVPVTLNSREKAGYSGNNGQPGVPTFLWTADAQELFGGSGKAKNPLVSAALRVDGNDDNELSENPDSQKDVSVYKHTIEWDNLNTATYTDGSNVSFNSEDHTVTVTANTPVMTFTFNYKIMKDGYVLKEKAATGIPYGRAVTFHPQYSDTSKYAYINDTIPSEGFSYWSADEEGKIPITTNLTFGMLIRGDFRHEEDDETVVTVYAQYNKTPKNDWTPLIEEAKLTHTVEDTGGRQIDWLYLDYMTNYLSKDGSVVKDMIVAGNSNIRYGIVAVKHDGTKTPDQPKMIKIAQAMIKNDKQSAYLDSKKQAIAYRFEYGKPNDDVKPISNFNRVLYTLRTDTEKAENHTFSAIAYITVDGTNYFYSEVNSDIVVHDLIEN